MIRKRAGALIRWITILAVLIAVVAIGGQLGLVWLRPQVTVTTAVQGPVVQAFYATGTLLPEHEYPIKANNPGFLTEVLVDKGDVVKKNQPLAIVHEDAVQYRFDQAQAERQQKAALADESTSPVLAEYDARLKSTQALLDIALREQKRTTQMIEANAATQADLDRAMDRVKTLAGEVDQFVAQKAAKKLELQRDLDVADAALKISQWNMERQTIRSPIDGVVLDRPLTIGTRVAVNDHIMQVANVRPENLVMRAAVDEEDRTQVHEGQPVRISLYSFPNRIFEATVKKVYDKADPDRRTFEVDVRMNEPNPNFAAGMTGELAFIIDQKPVATVIPSQAVQAGNVWVVRDGQLARADVKLGLWSVERTEVVSGCEADARVVISPVAEMQPGQHVRTVFVDPVAAANLNKPKETTGGFRGFN